jgi:hypothetical protein
MRLKSAAPPGQSLSAGVLAYKPKTIKKEAITTEVEAIKVDIDWFIYYI